MGCIVSSTAVEALLKEKKILEEKGAAPSVRFTDRRARSFKKVMGRLAAAHR
jgi:hypothetical protein